MNRSKYFVFVPFCAMAAAYQAQGLVKYDYKASIKPIINLLIDSDINIVQMPCAEATFNNSLVRPPKGIDKYNTKEFCEHCDLLAQDVFKQIQDITTAGYKCLAILGIEQSPSCCVNYIYTNKGMQSRKGLFIERLYSLVKDKDIPLIGINRKNPSKAIANLQKIFKENI